MSASRTHIFDIFLACDQAIASGQLITRASKTDKEFHFQNWFAERLKGAEVLNDQQGRNSYPDFVAVDIPEGYEVKGLAWPGREADFDANSQVPTGFHNGRTIYYVFGRYPKANEPEYPVVDLVICHGDFLNADHNYVHENKSIKGFGSYGDIMIRDRKMYVVPSPFALTRGTTGQRTLILPEDAPVDERLEVAGRLIRIEAEKLVVGYQFDLRDNTLTPRYVDNPEAGKRHTFIAYRGHGRSQPEVSLTNRDPLEDVDE